MLIFDLRRIGTKLLHFRKQAGMTQMELAEAAGLSDRTYADIERGTANMRVETLLRICRALRITPNDLLVDEADEDAMDSQQLLERLEKCTQNNRNAALRLLDTFLNAVE